MSTSEGGAGLDSQSILTSSHPVSSHRLNPRSCATCRQRKVRCSRLHPCTNCAKAGIDCIFPGPGRAKRYARSADEIELAGRLQKVEQELQRLTERVDEPAGDGLVSAPAPAASTSSVSVCDGASAQPQRSPFPSPQSSHNTEREVGRLVLKAGQKQYVNDSFWANLGDQVGQPADACSS